MTFFHARPLALGISCYLLGILALTMTERFDCILPLSVGLFVLFFLLALVTFRSGTAKRAYSYPLLLSLAFFVVFCQGFFYAHTQLIPARALRGTTVVCEAVVEKSWKSGSAVVKTEEGIRLFVTPDSHPSDASALRENQRILATLCVDGEFKDNDHRFKSYGVWATATLVEQVSLGEQALSPMQELKAFLRSLLSPLKNADLASAILLGEDEDVDPSLQTALQSTGTQHVLCVSGLHVSILLLGIRRVLNLLSWSRTRQALILCAVCLFYTVLLDFAPSVSRAALMAVMAFTASAIRKNNDPLTSLFLACALLTLRDPCVLYDLSFQLSVLATLGILRIHLPLAQRIEAFGLFQRTGPFWLFLLKGVLRETVLSFVLTFAVTGFSLPVLLCLNPQINTLAFFSNLILIALFTPVLIAVSLYLLASLLFCLLSLGPIQEFLTRLCDGLLSIFERAVCALEESSCLLSLSREDFVPTALILSVLLLLAVLLIHDRRKTLFLSLFSLLFPLVLGMNALTHQEPTGKLILLHRSSQQILWMEHKGKALLYLSEPLENENLLSAILKESELKKPDAVLLTFSDAEATHYRLQALFPEAVYYLPQDHLLSLSEPQANPLPSQDQWEPLPGLTLHLQRDSDGDRLDLLFEGASVSLCHGYDQRLTPYRSFFDQAPDLLLAMDCPALLPSESLGSATVFSDDSFALQGSQRVEIPENRLLLVNLLEHTLSYRLLLFKTAGS